MASRTFSVYRRSQPRLRLAPPAAALRPGGDRPSANDRFKRSLWPAFLVGILPAVIIHYAILVLFPRFAIPATWDEDGAIIALELPPDVSIPPPPEPVARPAMPVVSPLEVSEELTIAPTTFAAFDATRSDRFLPPPAFEPQDDGPRFVPYDVPPQLVNREEALALLDRVYPDALKRARLGGTVELWIHVGEEGAVLDCRVARSSGRTALDDAARVVAFAMRFVPARTRDRAAAVWITQPIVFRVI